MALTLACTIQQSPDVERVWHAAWSSDGRFIATCGEDKVVKIWSVVIDSSGVHAECISTLEDAQSRTIRSCEWCPSGQFIASASFDGTVVIWESLNSTKRKWDQVASLEGHDSEVKSVAWSPDGTWLATCGRDKKVWVWEKLPNCEFECVSVLEGHTQDVKFVRWHPSDSVLYSTSYDDTIKVWGEDNDDWYCIETLTGHSSTVWAVAVSSDGHRLVTCSDDKSLRLWDSDKTGRVGSYRSNGRLSDLHDYAVYSCDWSPHHGRVATGGGDNAVTVCEVGSGETDELISLQVRREQAHDGDVNCVRWNPRPEWAHVLVSAGDDGHVRFWVMNL